jgi:hypothetical protein
MQHPHIVPAYKKEIHFFDVNFAQGTNWYRMHFPFWFHKVWAKHVESSHLITGEASPYYIFHPQVPERMAKVLPDIKLIVLLRNPIERAYSHYWHMVRQGHETLAFEEAIASEPTRLQSERERLISDKQYHSPNHRRYSYLTRGIYVDQLKIWKKFFPCEQFLILNSETLYTNPSSCMKRVFEFLNVSSWQIETHTKYNQAIYPRMNPTTRGQLIDYFQPHNERLYTHLGLRYSWE